MLHVADSDGDIVVNHRKMIELFELGSSLNIRAQRFTLKYTPLPPKKKKLSAVNLTIYSLWKDKLNVSSWMHNLVHIM